MNYCGEGTDLSPSPVLDYLGVLNYSLILFMGVLNYYSALIHLPNLWVSWITLDYCWITAIFLTPAGLEP